MAKMRLRALSAGLKEEASVKEIWRLCITGVHSQYIIDLERAVI